MGQPLPGPAPAVPVTGRWTGTGEAKLAPPEVQAETDGRGSISNLMETLHRTFLGGKIIRAAFPAAISSGRTFSIGA